MPPLKRPFLSGRPFLWWWAVVVAPALASFWWERGISYDDNGLGTATFVVMITLGLPFVAGVIALGVLIPNIDSWPLAIAVPLGFAAGSAPFFIADAIARRWLRRRDEHQANRLTAAAAVTELATAVERAKGRRSQAP